MPNKYCKYYPCPDTIIFNKLPVWRRSFYRFYFAGEHRLDEQTCLQTSIQYLFAAGCFLLQCSNGRWGFCLPNAIGLFGSQILIIDHVDSAWPLGTLLICSFKPRVSVCTLANCMYSITRSTVMLLSSFYFAGLFWRTSA